MANTYTEVIPKLLAQGLMALRQNAVIPQLVNRAYESTAGRKGSTIDVPIPSALTASAVTPGAAPVAGSNSAPTSVPIPLDQWFEASFFLTDKEVLEVMEGTIPMQASEAVKAIGNNVDNYLLGLAAGFAGAAGVAATTPFGTDTSEITEARKVLNEQLAPMDDRRVVLDPAAEAEALGLRAFQDASWAASADVIRDAKLNRKLGFNWFMDQNVGLHTAGTGTGYLVKAATPAAAGQKVIETDTGSGTILPGDVITIAGDATKYVVASSVGGGTVTSITLTKNLAITADATDAITVSASHTVNPVFHRDAIAFATRPLESASFGLGNFRAETDPVTGLTLRLEIERQHRQTKFSYDILYGAAVVRPEFGVKLMG